MVPISQLRPAKRFGPGYFIKEQLELRDWNQEEFAEITGFTQKHISEILNDKKPVSLEMARILSEVFNTSAQYWANLDSAYRLWLEKSQSNKEAEVNLKAKIYERMPVKDMVKKGWLLKPQNTTHLTQQVLDFWNKKKLDFADLDREWLPYLSRRSPAYNQYNAAYAMTWYQKAQLEASKIQTNPFSKEKLNELTRNLYTYTSKADGISAFLHELELVGVKFFILPHLEKTYLDGAAFFSGKNPTIVYTGRYKRIDHFWFTLAHELAHVLLHLNEKTPFILDNLHNGERDQLEEEANELAGKMLKHPQIYSTLKDDIHYLTTARVEECAATYQVHPSIVIGKLAHEGKTHFRNMHLYNENVLAQIPGRYLID